MNDFEIVTLDPLISWRFPLPGPTSDLARTPGTLKSLVLMVFSEGLRCIERCLKDTVPGGHNVCGIRIVQNQAVGLFDQGDLWYL